MVFAFWQRDHSKGRATNHVTLYIYNHTKAPTVLYFSTPVRIIKILITKFIKIILPIWETEKWDLFVFHVEGTSNRRISDSYYILDGLFQSNKDVCDMYSFIPESHI